MKAILCAGLKGGVGKTTLAVNIARKLGNATVVDSDIDSSNFASVMNVEDKAEVTKDHEIKPVSTDGVDIYSVETLFRSSALSLREGEERRFVDRLVHHALKDEPEHLVVDCPPGSSSAFRGVIDSLSKRNVERATLAISQPNALSDLERFVVICNHLLLPIMGFVENMSGVEGSNLAPFGRGGVEDYCDELGGNFFGRIPLADRGKRDEVVEPVAEKVVNYMDDNNPFMNENIYPKAGFWDKLKTGLNIGLDALSQNLPIGELGKEYGFEEDNLTLQVHITDLDKKLNFGVRGDSIKFVRNPKNLAGGVKISLKELRDALRFKKEVLDSPTGKMTTKDYSITEAVKLGFASVWENPDFDLPIDMDPYDMLIMLEFILRDVIGTERIEKISREAGVDEI